MEPTESRVHLGAAHSPHTILGIGAGVPPISSLNWLQISHVSEFLSATSSESIEWATKLAKMEGIMVGPSSGATLKVAMDLAGRPEAKGKTIVVIAASHGIRYTAHPLWKEMKEEAKVALPQPPNMSKEEGTLFWDSSKRS